MRKTTKEKKIKWSANGEVMKIKQGHVKQTGVY